MTFTMNDVSPNDAMVRVLSMCCQIYSMMSILPLLYSNYSRWSKAHDELVECVFNDA